jgi:hypothetical protein
VVAPASPDSPGQRSSPSGASMGVDPPITSAPSTVSTHLASIRALAMNKGVLRKKGDVAALEAALRGLCDAEGATAEETSPSGGTQPWQLPARSAGDRAGSGLQATEDATLNYDLDPKSFRS